MHLVFIITEDDTFGKRLCDSNGEEVRVVEIMNQEAVKEKLHSSDREKQKEETIEIIVKERKSSRARSKYAWAWRESAEMNVFGGANSLDEIKRRAERMFPGAKLILFLL